MCSCVTPHPPHAHLPMPTRPRLFPASPRLQPPFPECRWSRGCFPFSRGKPHNLLGLSRAAPQGQISVLVLLPGAWASWIKHQGALCPRLQS